MRANKKYKDSMFRTIFNNPEKALELYNAVTGKNLDGGTQIEIQDLKTILLSKLRNDLSFIINGRLGAV
jgi:hypothetical protein